MTKIIAIHGAGMTGAIWEDLVPFLNGIEVIALDLPGHNGGEDSYPLASIEDMAFWVKDRLPGEDCILMGHSMGALVALSLSEEAEQVIAALLLGMAPAMPVNPDLLRMAQEQPAQAAEMILKWGVYNGNPQADEIRAEIMKKMTPASLAADLKACDRFMGGLNMAGRSTKPVLVITGEKDKMANPEEAMQMAGAFLKGRHAQIAGCGHMMMVEKPAETAREILSFFGD